MSCVPTDRRILVKYYPTYYSLRVDGYEPAKSTVIVECWHRDGKLVEWLGDPNMHTTGRITHTVAWCEVPT